MTRVTDRARPPAEVQSEGGEGLAAPSTEAAGDEAIPIRGFTRDRHILSASRI